MEEPCTWGPPHIGAKTIWPAQSQDMHIPGETKIQKQHPTNKTQSVTMRLSEFGLVPSPEHKKTKHKRLVYMYLH